MILFPILLAFVTGLLILRLCNQHKYLNIFEQLALGFCTALSLFVFELFVGGVVFNKLSLIGPIISFVVCVGLLIYKNNKYPGFIKEIIYHIKADVEKVKIQFQGLKKWQQYVVIGIGIYVIFKLVMVFSINISQPTVDDDAVTGWDLKTKVFVENRSLMLDKTNVEFLGSELGRNVFAPLTDTYFLLSLKGDLNGFTNIISPLLYLLSILLLFGIFIRKTNIFWAAISGYIFTSLPFVSVHGFGAYWNFISGVLLFIFVFYILDQILHLENEAVLNKGILLSLSLLGFLTTTIRNESFILVLAITITCSLVYYYTKRKHTLDIKNAFFAIIGPIFGILIGWISSKYILSLYPKGVDLNVGGIGTKTGLLGSLFENINQAGVFTAPFNQAFYHSDYNNLFLLLSIGIILFFALKLDYKKILFYLISFLVLLGGTLFILYSNLDMGLITHFGFIRFGIVFVLFIVFLITYSCYSIITNILPDNN